MRNIMVHCKSAMNQYERFLVFFFVNKLYKRVLVQTSIMSDCVGEFKNEQLSDLQSYSSKLKNRICQCCHVCCQGVGYDKGKSVKEGEKAIEDPWKVRCSIGIRISTALFGPISVFLLLQRRYSGKP